MLQPVRKAVFPVAGLGTRFLPATKAVPKELLPIVDRPLIQYAIEECMAAGIDEFVFVNGRGKSAIDDYLDHAFELETILHEKGNTEALDLLKSTKPEPGKVAVVRQQQPLGLGHAVWCAKNFVGHEPFAVVLPDDFVDATPGAMAQMVAAYEKTGGNVIAVENVPLEMTNRYGVLDPGADDGSLVEVKGLVEKPEPAEAPSTLTIYGRYILLPEVFDHLDAHETGAGGEIQLTDAMAKMIATHPFHGLRVVGTRYDCGSKLGFLKANMAMALARDEFSQDLREIMSDLLKTQ
ncbi:MAG: UTP--glucose-1-phosphate uridylyltransferase GalU [Alphaproteobacteria bacterium]|nr:MAG: UTP--glucose-1-phosphate uridylyltransferase GalU [Alphaproteobacteria bacterium]